VTSLPVSTFELLQQEQKELNQTEFDRSKESRSMLPLTIHVSHNELEKIVQNHSGENKTGKHEDDRLYGIRYVFHSTTVY
jgi:hypothetical protein